MNGLDYAQARPHDLHMYFNNCIAVHNETGACGAVTIDEGRFFSRALNVNSMPPRQFFQHHSIYKFKLGWFNWNTSAVLLTYRTERSTKKGYCRGRFRVINPYLDAITRRIGSLIRDGSALRDRLLVKSNQLDPGTVLGNLQNIHGSITAPVYMPGRQAVGECNAGTRSGAAMSRNFAVSYSQHHCADNISLYRGSTVIGRVSRSTGDMFVHRDYESFIPEMQREIHDLPTIGIDP